jgi:DNA-binding MarR family transcriptional regulator
MQLHSSTILRISQLWIAMQNPSPQTVSAWARLVRVQQALLAAVEADLKEEGFPPLAWYDALLELARAPDGKLRPLELEKAMLLPQYGMSRLVDRLENAGLAQREACPVDGRGQMVAVTPTGRSLQKKMWETYAAAIERHVGAKLTPAQAEQLGTLLHKLAPCPTTDLASLPLAAKRERRPGARTRRTG